MKHPFGVQTVVAHAEGEYVRHEDHLAAMEALKGKLEEGDRIYAKGKPEIWQDHEGRIKALERSRFLLDGCIEICKKHEERLKELEQLMTEKTSIIDHAFEVDKMLKKRIEGLEKALNEHMVKEREKTKTASDEGMTEAFGVGWNIIIDPKASPTGIPFEVALAYAKAGRKIRRAPWRKAWVEMDGTGMWFHNGFSVPSCLPFSLPYDTFDAVDWEVIPEKP